MPKKPELPEVVAVDGLNYAVCLSDHIVTGAGESLCGYVEWELRIIHIAKRVDGKRTKRRERLDILVHEMTHIIVRSDGEIAERFVTDVAHEVARAVTRNGIAGVKSKGKTP